MKFQISGAFLSQKTALKSMVENFNQSGEDFIVGNRNAIKLFEIGGQTLNIKSFRIPNLINKVAYKYFRKSKASRSFEYANRLISANIGTPQPIAFFENYDAVGLKDSYYISEHLQADLTFRELVTYPEYPDHENILRQFTRFSYQLHENGIEFLDHSPGNTLVKKIGDNQYKFYLVDLNRMKFHDNMDFQTRMKNLRRLTPKEEMIAVMSDEYSKISGQKYDFVFKTLLDLTNDFQKKLRKKKKLKKVLKFWKK